MEGNKVISREEIYEGIENPLKGLDEFLNKLDKYSPRDYIIENHTLKMGAEKYYNILLEINGKK